MKRGFEVVRGLIFIVSYMEVCLPFCFDFLLPYFVCLSCDKEILIITSGLFKISDFCLLIDLLVISCCRESFTLIKGSEVHFPVASCTLFALSCIIKVPSIVVSREITFLKCFGKLKVSCFYKWKTFYIVNIQ